MNAALKLIPRYESPIETFAEAPAIKHELRGEFTALSTNSPDQLLQAQLEELQGLVADLREKLALAQWDLSQKETLLHSHLQREMELRSTFIKSRAAVSS